MVTVWGNMICRMLGRRVWLRIQDIMFEPNFAMLETIWDSFHIDPACFYFTNCTSNNDTEISSSNPSSRQALHYLRLMTYPQTVTPMKTSRRIMTTIACSSLNASRT